MESSIRFAMFDNCNVRTAALIKALHLAGHYRVVFHHRVCPTSAGSASFAEVDAALLAVGNDTGIELDVIAALRKQLGDRPVMAYAIHSEASARFRRFVDEAEGQGPHMWRLRACFGPFAESEDLVRALDELLKPSHLANAKPRAAAQPAHLLEDLSARERQILRLIGQGKSFKEMSTELHLSLNSVHTYAKRIRAKRCLASNAELLRLAVSLSQIW